jgi:hypothetical protein
MMLADGVGGLKEMIVNLADHKEQSGFSNQV